MIPTFPTCTGRHATLHRSGVIPVQLSRGLQTFPGASQLEAWRWRPDRRIRRSRVEGSSQNGVDKSTVEHPRVANGLSNGVGNGMSMSIGDSLASLVEKAQASIMQVRSQLDAARVEITRLRAELEIEKGKNIVLESELQATRNEMETLREAAETWEAAATAMEVSAANGISQLPPPEPEVVMDTITLFYHTGWNPVYVHFNLDDQGWTEAPGFPLRPEGEESSGVHSISLPGRSVQFVMTDGKGHWDKPHPGDGGNYTVTQPGSYLLLGGEIKDLGTTAAEEEEGTSPPRSDTHELYEVHAGAL